MICEMWPGGGLLLLSWEAQTMRKHGPRMAVSHLEILSVLEITLSLQAFERCEEQLKLLTGWSLALFWHLECVRRNASKSPP